MKKSQTMWALYERKAGKVCWSALEGGTMVFDSRKDAIKMKSMLRKDFDDGGISIVRWSITTKTVK